MEKKPLNEVIKLVTNANHPYAGSMYTKEDVLNILNEIAEQPTTLTDDQVEKLKKLVKSAIRNLDKNDVVDCESFGFDIECHNHIVVSDFTIDEDKIWDEVECAIDDFTDTE